MEWCSYVSGNNDTGRSPKEGETESYSIIWKYLNKHLKLQLLADHFQMWNIWINNYIFAKASKINVLKIIKEMIG
jgi:hypothetical protein